MSRNVQLLHPPALWWSDRKKINAKWVQIRDTRSLYVSSLRIIWVLCISSYFIRDDVDDHKCVVDKRTGFFKIIEPYYLRKRKREYYRFTSYKRYEAPVWQEWSRGTLLNETELEVAALVYYDTLAHIRAWPRAHEMAWICSQSTRDLISNGTEEPDWLEYELKDWGPNEVALLTVERMLASPSPMEDPLWYTHRICRSNTPLRLPVPNFGGPWQGRIPTDLAHDPIRQTERAALVQLLTRIFFGTNLVGSLPQGDYDSSSEDNTHIPHSPETDSNNGETNTGSTCH